MRALAALIIAAVGVAAFFVAWKKISHEVRHHIVHEAPVTGPIVKVNYRVIHYIEAEDRYLELAWEARTGDRRPIAYVPTESYWRKLMPDWAWERRDEIMGTIKAKTVRMDFEWKEYDGS